MKILILLSLVSINSIAAPLCEVFGISDSPQSFNCSFSGEELHLTCQNGTYYFGNEVVETAYHLEVEEGPTPLVFRTKNGELTVTMINNRKNQAELVRAGKKLTGNCRI